MNFFKIQKEKKIIFEPARGRTWNLLIRSQTRFHCATSPLLLIFLLLLFFERKRKQQEKSNNNNPKRNEHESNHSNRPPLRPPLLSSDGRLFWPRVARGGRLEDIRGGPGGDEEHREAHDDHLPQGVVVKQSSTAT